MRIFIYLYMLKLIAHADSTTNPKAVNVQLETVLEFNDKDKEADVKFIGNIQKILKKVKAALSPESGRRSLNNNYSFKKQIKFTDFILAALDILLSYDDDVLEHAFAILDDEIRKYHYKGCKFYELVEDQNVRIFVARNLESLKNKKAKTLRRKLYKLGTMIVNAKLIPTHRKFLDYINSLYGYESSKIFMNVLQNLENYRYKSKRSNMNLIEITRLGIRSILFDYFSKLNPNVRKDIKKNIESNWNHHENSKQKHTAEYKENDFVKTKADETKTGYNSKEDEDKGSNSVSNELNNEIKSTPGKQKHATKKRKSSKKPSSDQLPVKNTIKERNQEYTTKKVKFERLWKKRADNGTNESKDFLIPIENADLKAQNLKRKERKEKIKRQGKHNKIKTHMNESKIIEDSERKETKRKKKNHQKSELNVEKRETAENTVVENGETRNVLRSESLMIRPKLGLLENIFFNLNKLAENRHSNTPALPRKRKHGIKRKLFSKPTSKLSLHSLSNEAGFSIEHENYRRTITSDTDSEMEKETDKEHKVSAEIIRKHFMKRINNLEKQMEEIIKKVDSTPSNNDNHKIKVTEKETESTTDLSNRDKLNITAKAKTKGTTIHYHILVDPEYISKNNNISNNIKKLNSTEDKTNSFGNDAKTNISDNNDFLVNDNTSYITDFDYSEAAIMKKLNINITLPEEKSNDEITQEKPKQPDSDKIKDKDGLHRIDIPMDNEIAQE